MAIRTRSAQEWTEKTQKRAASAATDWSAGINRVDESPMEKAAANVDGYVNGVMAAAQSGEWQGSLRRVSLQEWKTQTVGKGQQRYSQGIQAATVKMQRGGAMLLDAIREAQAAIAGMSRATRADRIARSAAYQEAMAEAIAKRKAQG